MLIAVISISETAAQDSASSTEIPRVGHHAEAADGRELNLNFETGDLRDWTATGDDGEQYALKVQELFGLQDQSNGSVKGRA